MPWGHQRFKKCPLNATMVHFERFGNCFQGGGLICSALRLGNDVWKVERVVVLHSPAGLTYLSSSSLRASSVRASSVRAYVTRGVELQPV